MGQSEAQRDPVLVSLAPGGIPGSTRSVPHDGHAHTCAQLHTYVHTGMYTRVHNYTHTSAQARTHVCTTTHIRAHRHTHVRTATHTRAHRHTYMCAQLHTYVCTGSHMCTHRHAHTCAQAHTHTCTGTHTRVPSPACNRDFFSRSWLRLLSLGLEPAGCPSDTLPTSVIETRGS